ncbi:MAG TPA: hypothetical protein VJK09_03135 [Candidatus Paceibacterota bacterium]
MSAWGVRRQLSFVLVFMLLLVLATVIFIIANRRVPSCSDGIANQGELGEDCGGPCQVVCQSEADDLVVLWTRVFKVGEGLYDVVAYIENPNPFGLANYPYSIRIYDADNVPVKDVSGSTYLNPHQRFIIFEPRVNVGFRIPTRAFVSFPQEPDWQRLSSVRDVSLVLSNQHIETSSILALRVTLTNESLFPLENVELAALLYNSDGNVVHASRTYVDHIGIGESRELVFTWPIIPSEVVVGADVLARVNLVK